MAQFSHTGRLDQARLSPSRVVTQVTPKASCPGASSTFSLRLDKSRTSICWPREIATEVRQDPRAIQLASSICTIRLCSETNESMRSNLRSNASILRSTTKPSMTCWTRTHAALPSFKSEKTRDRLSWRTAQRGMWRTTKKSWQWSMKVRLTAMSLPQAWTSSAPDLTPSSPHSSKRPLCTKTARNVSAQVAFTLSI